MVLPALLGSVFVPLPAAERKLEGLYLSHDLRQHYLKSGRAFVYANFVTSIDGRIAVPRSNGNGLVVPKNIANKRDWRLFQELAAQADIIISSGRYLRDWANRSAPGFSTLTDTFLTPGVSKQ